ncbi:MAG: folylpolyglutamate synthase/dihydrofolate synthase family protein [Bacteroidota bacterium]
MTYPETTAYLYSRLPMYQSIGAGALKKDLTNILTLCEALGNPQDQIQTIHVAGTNGKGTVSHLIAAYLQTAGHQVGLYTSPHYTDFRERIKINGHWIGEEDVVEWVRCHRKLIEEVSPSFFEITVAMAFEYFKSKSIDFAVIETGLGGRLDSTNIISPLLSVITQISLDHQHLLGSTIYEIAGEKAGIIKSDTPVVIGEYQPSCDHVFIAKSKRCNAPLSWASLRWQAKADTERIQFSERTKTYDVRIDQADPFLVKNMITSLESIHRLDEYGIVPTDQDILQTSLSNYRHITKYIGRWQVIQNTPLVIADSGHNAAALQSIGNRLKTYPQRVHIIMGMANDKDVASLIKHLPTSAKYYFVQASIRRAMSSAELRKIAVQSGRIGQAYDTISEAYKSALSAASEHDIIFVGGSSFVVGDFLAGLNGSYFANRPDKS